ncbi:protein NLRC5-like isoform X3 [Sardina pilchardus]|uniref:protein NLRC5-like isoform X3 n=1 Tax=Sardina pilchardus TaxID=27697 RepID=UPI002E0F70CF
MEKDTDNLLSKINTSTKTRAGPPTHRPPSPVPSCVSMKSDMSLPEPPHFSCGPVPSGLEPQTHRPPSPVPSCVSMKSVMSLPEPPHFSCGPVPSGLEPQTDRPPSPVPSCVSMKSDMSLPEPPHFSCGPVPSGLEPQTHRPRSPVPSCVSMKSDMSLPEPPHFSSGPVPSGLEPQTHRPPSPVPSCVSMKSVMSLPEPPHFSSGPVPSGLDELSADLTQDQSTCGVCEQVLRDPVITTCGHSFCRQCISNYWEQPGLSGDQACPQCGKTCRTQPPLQLPLDEHTNMNTQDEHTDMNTQVEHTGLINGRRHLHTENAPGRKRELDGDLKRVIENHKASLKRRFENISEGISKSGAEILLNKIYTELYITEGESKGVNKEHEVWQVESAFRSQTTVDKPINCNDIFKTLPGQKKQIRTVMTKGVAGIGKTVSVQKFILDWTDGIANQDIDFMFPLSFRELNLVRDDQYSLHRLLIELHPELKELNDGKEYKDCQVIFIFDGLDESRSSFDFQQKGMTDLNQTSLVDLLMTSLIQGTLIPSALIWITSRPAAASQIPLHYIDQVTEVRGFNDPQKEEYFRKRISDEGQANRVITHIKASRSLYIMCHIPVFCWIAATVLQQMLDKNQDVPKTLSEMFINFLLIQTARKSQKYEGRCEEDNKVILESQNSTILKLAELAYKNLLKGNLMFYEEDLNECGIDVSEASVYSGICTEIFKEETVFHQEKIYSFVHLSIQEFLAALHVFLSFKSMNEKLSAPEISVKKEQLPLEELLEKAANKALQSKNGHLDLFLRFLMGISIERNQILLQGLLKHPLNSSESIRKTCKYIKELNREDLSPERCINLFHCLFEMDDHSMHKDIQEYLKSPKDFKGHLSPAHCSALAQMLLMSDEVMDEVYLKEYNTSDEGRRRLIPAVKCCRKARLADCKLNNTSLETLALVLQSSNFLTELDLSKNDLKDSGLQLLSAGLCSPKCKLQVLRLCECGISNEGYVCLVLALMLNPSCVKELDVSNNNPGESAQKLLSSTLEDPHRKVETLQLADCKLNNTSLETLALVLQSPNSLITLDLSNNDLNDAGVQQLSAGLCSPKCKLQTLRLPGCNLSKESCRIIASLLQSPNSLITLDLSNNHLKDAGVEHLSAGMHSLNCKLQTLRLPGCNLSKESCRIIASLLQSPNSLITLDLSNNDLNDAGVEHLSAGMHSLNCKLQTLRLCECGISNEGYVCLVLALMLNPSCVKELGVSNNNPGESAQKLLSSTLEDPHRKVETLQLADCKLNNTSLETLALVLQSPNSLITLDLSNNDLNDAGVQQLSAGLCSPKCKLQILRLPGCNLSKESCRIIASLLQSPNSLITLDLSNNDLNDAGVEHLSAGMHSLNCKLQTLRLADCKLNNTSLETLALVLQSPNSLITLDLSNNDLNDAGVQQLSAGLCSPKCKLQILRLPGCNLSKESCRIIASLLQSPNSLITLDLSNNDLNDAGVQQLSAGMHSLNCKLQTLRLAGCKLHSGSCESLARFLESPNSLVELDLSDNDFGDYGVDHLSEGLCSPNCKLQILRLAGCELSSGSCVNLARVLESPNSLIELDLSNNKLCQCYYYDVEDEGVDLLSKGLRSPNCKLQILRLSKCGISDGGYVCLALALMLNPSCVKELDVSNNNPGESAQKLLSATLEDPHRKVETLQLAGCTLSSGSCKILASFLQSPNSLIELDLSNSDFGHDQVDLLSEGLRSTNCKLQILRLTGCKLSFGSCESLARVLESPNFLIELDMSDSKLSQYGYGYYDEGYGNNGVCCLSKGLRSPNCKLQILRLSKCGISDGGYVCLALALMLNPSCVKELDVSNNNPGESAQKLLSTTLEDPHRKVETLQLAGCKLCSGSCESLARFLESPNSLVELDLSDNYFGDEGVDLLFEGLRSPNCKLQILRLSKCGISDGGYVCLALALMLNPSCVKELDVSNNNPGESAQKLLSTTLEDPHRKVETLQLAGCKFCSGSCESLARFLESPNSLVELDLSDNYFGDEGVDLLFEGLRSPNCKLQILRLAGCDLLSGSCESLARVLESPNSLVELDLSDNYFGDEGVDLLFEGLRSPNCKLQILSLRDCEISEKSCRYLASALTSNPSHLKQLDLSENSLRKSVLNRFSATLKDPLCALEILI